MIKIDLDKLDNYFNIDHYCIYLLTEVSNLYYVDQQKSLIDIVGDIQSSFCIHDLEKFPKIIDDSVNNLRLRSPKLFKDLLRRRSQVHYRELTLGFNLLKKSLDFRIMDPRYLIEVNNDDNYLFKPHC